MVEEEMQVTRKQWKASYWIMNGLWIILVLIIFYTLLSSSPKVDSAITLSQEGNRIIVNCTKINTNITKYNSEIAFRADGVQGIKLNAVESCAIVLGTATATNTTVQIK